MADGRERGAPTVRPPWAVASLAAFLAASLCAWDGGAQRTFFVPKLILTYAAAAAALAVLLSRRELRWPGARVAVGAGAAFAAMALLAWRAAAPGAAWVELSVLACGAVLFLAVVQLSERERRLLSAAVVAAAALQLGIAVLQAGGARALLPSALQPRPDLAAYGSVGNPEFLATLLGVAAALALALLPRAQGPAQWRYAAPIVAALAVGLLAARNKGGLALLGGWLFWQALARWPRVRGWLLVTGMLLCLAAVARFAPDSVKGRVLLWLASGQMIADHPWLGVGAGQVQNAYLPAVQALFARHPWAAAWLGSYTAQVDDAHDLLLQSWASLGVTGLIAAVALLVISLRVGRRAGAHGWALAWLALKSLYTVVLGSLSGTMLWALALGLGPWQWEPAPMGARRRWLLALGVGVALAPAWFGVRLALADRAYRRGLVAEARGDGGAALAAYEEAVSWQPGLAEAHLGKAHVRFGRGEREEMQRDLEEALARSRTMDVVKIAAHMRFYSHLYAEAEPLYGFLHEVYPEHLTSIAKLALIRLEAGDEEGARALARELLATRPRHRNDSDAANREIARRILEEP